MVPDPVLYVVATPIGNLGDITYRAVETLKSVDLVLCEDTRQTKKLLDKYQILTSLKSYRDQNHHEIVDAVIKALKQGISIALVSDSGTPLISDPGYKLIRDVINAGCAVTPIPGPSAVIAALSISGLPTDRYTFLGFLPKSESKRANLLKKYGEFESTIIIYESPHRVIKLLKEINENLGNREVCLACELTKRFEKIQRGKINELLLLLSDKNLKGEYTVILSKML